MLYGHMTINSKHAALEEIGHQVSNRVFCLECNEVEELKIGNFSFDDDFGGVSDYQVVTESCEGDNWARAECEVCGADGTEEILRHPDGRIRRDENGFAVKAPAKKLVRAPKQSDLRVVCESCLKDVENELKEEENV